MENMQGKLKRFFMFSPLVERQQERLHELLDKSCSPQINSFQLNKQTWRLLDD